MKPGNWKKDRLRALAIAKKRPAAKKAAAKKAAEPKEPKPAAKKAK